jgi:thiamine kinase-like enzyme
MTSQPPPSRVELLDGLRSALAGVGGRWAAARLELLPDKGLAHDHVRLRGTGVLARIPKQSQLGLGPLANLEHQRACFERAAASGHTPRLQGWLLPTAALPRGGLLVQEIEGPSASLPKDLAAIARALAQLHRLPVPPAPLRPPLSSPQDPLRALWLEIDTQAQHFAAAGLAPAALSSVQAELGRLGETVGQRARPPVHLIAFDSHPGNFIMRDQEHAILVDLEKCRYSYPGLDLAHATLYTSTTWDVDSCAVLSVEEVLGFYRAWSRALGPAAESSRAWHVPLRRAMWLWSLSWCAKWRAMSGRRPDPAAAGEDWSAEHSHSALVTHVRGRVDHYLSGPVIAAALAEFEALDKAFAR